MATTSSRAVIEPHLLYGLAEFQRLTGMGRHALRAARRAGLEVKYTAGRGWIRGQAWIDYVVRMGGDEHHGGGSTAPAAQNGESSAFVH